MFVILCVNSFAKTFLAVFSGLICWHKSPSVFRFHYWLCCLVFYSHVSFHPLFCHLPLPHSPPLVHWLLSHCCLLLLYFQFHHCCNPVSLLCSGCPHHLIGFSVSPSLFVSVSLFPFPPLFSNILHFHCLIQFCQLCLCFLKLVLFLLV